MEVAMDKAWAGVDLGKGLHWAHVLDASGRELLSRKVQNDEADISVTTEGCEEATRSSSGTSTSRRSPAYETSGVQSLLRSQEGRRQEAHPGTGCAGPKEGQRSVG